MLKESIKKFIMDSITEKEEELKNKYLIAKKLENKLKPNNIESILFVANEYCNFSCKDSTNLTTFSNCAYKCRIWKLKNKAKNLGVGN